MKRMIMMCALLLGLSGVVLAQGTGEVWGRVIDKKTGLTLPGVNVFVKNGASMIGVQSDANGEFRLKPLPPGTYSILFSYMGYGDGRVEQVTVYSDAILKIGDYNMTPGLELSEVVIPGIKEIGTDAVPRMTSKDLAVIPGSRDIKGVIGMMTTDAYKTDDGALYFRGARDNDMVYYIDGIKVGANDMKVPTTAIGSIQVYTGGVPARYGDFTGGCVVIETQSYFDWLNSRN